MTSMGKGWRIERNPISLEARTRKQEDEWSREGLIPALTESRPVFDWENGFRSDSV